MKIMDRLRRITKKSKFVCRISNTSSDRNKNDFYFFMDSKCGIGSSVQKKHSLSVS